MAYGVKYELIFNNIYVQDPSLALSAYRLRIYKDSYVGAVYGLKCSTEPIVIETVDSQGNTYNPIISTRATVNAIIDSNFNAIEFLSADPDTFMVTLEIGAYGGSFVSSSVIWRGLFQPVDNINFNVVGVKEISLVFIDGLSKLKNSKLYFSSDYVLGFKADSSLTFIQYLATCLEQTDLTLDIYLNEYYNTASVSTPNVSNIYVKKNFFCEEPGNYYTHYQILEMLCRIYGWMVYQKDDHWQFESYGSVTRESNYTYYKFNYLGGYLATLTGSFANSITVDATNSFKQESQSMTITLNKGKSSLKIISPINNIKGMANMFFQSWDGSIPDGFTVQATPAISKYNSDGGLLITSSTTNSANFQNYIYSERIEVKAGDFLNISWDDQGFANGNPRYRIELDTTNPNIGLLFVNDYGNFVMSTTTLSFFNTVSATWKNGILIPNDGFVRIYIYEPYWDGTSTPPELILRNFLVNMYGVNTTLYNYNGIQKQIVENARYNIGEETYYDGPYFMQTVLQATISDNANINDIAGYCSSIYIGTIQKLHDLPVPNQFGRTTPNTSLLFELVYQDIGIDELQTQYVIEGDFKSSGYWLNQEFSYDFTGTGNYIYNYLMRDFKWSVRSAIQSVKLNRINYTGTTYPFVQNPIILKNK